MRGVHRSVVSIAVATGLACAITGAAQAAPAAAPNWHVGTYAPSGRALSQAHAARTASGLATFQFSSDPSTALLLNTQGSTRGSLLGDLTGKTVNAVFTITGNGTFSYYGEPAACNAPASARLFFETSGAGGFNETHYWWANVEGGSQPLGDGQFSVTATVAGNQWSDYNGHFGTGSYAAGFDAAAADVTGIGLSFGGGCGFENGVGAPDTTLTLNSIAVR